MSSLEKPTVGRIVHVRLVTPPGERNVLLESQTDVVPAVVVNDWPDDPDATYLNLQALPDGPAPAWLTSVHHEDDPASQGIVNGAVWFWPPRA